MKYYVYTLARPDGSVFYVGKGCGSRIKQHEQEALRGHDCPKCALIRSIWRQGGSVQRAIVFETDDEQDALTHEMALITAYGPSHLVNRGGGWLFRSTSTRCISARSIGGDGWTGVLDQLFQSHRHRVHAL